MLAFRRPTPKLSLENAKEGPAKATKTKNVVIFGETGVGKSSLVNLIAGERLSKTSSGAAGCTLVYTRHSLKLDDQEFTVWDTAGLGEGTEGTVPAEKAEAYLKKLLQDLSKANGIDLLIYCVRGTRVRSALLANYHLFYSAICRKKVPIVIVITGLENQEGNMDTWWLDNEEQFSALRMHFSDYACVTTLEPSMENPVLQERRRISRRALVKMITNTCRTELWTPSSERSWIDTAFFDIRSMLSPSLTRQATHVANVIMCDVSRQSPVLQRTVKHSVTFHNPVSLSRSLARPMTFRLPVLVVNEKIQSKLPFNNAMKYTPERLFRVYQVPRKQASSTGKGSKDGTNKDMIVQRGADLLVFCLRIQDEEYGNVKLQWDHFNITYGGNLSPQVVVVIGARDQPSAEKWWNDEMGRTGDASIAYWPVSNSAVETETAKSRLRDLINDRCIDCSNAKFARDKRIFRRAGTLNPFHSKEKSMPPLWTGAGNSKITAPATADQDVLTEFGVWEHISPG